VLVVAYVTSEEHLQVMASKLHTLAGVLVGVGATLRWRLTANGQPTVPVRGKLPFDGKGMALIRQQQALQPSGEFCRMQMRRT
jgi:hypothetical protein